MGESIALTDDHRGSATMSHAIRTTAAGEIDPIERKTIAVYGIEDVVKRRETARVSTPDGGYIHIDVYPAEAGGSATTPVIVFIGGLSAHAMAYAEFESRLSLRGFNVLAIDLRGHGRSSGRRGDFTVATLLEDVDAAIDYGLERFGGPVGVAGSSLGGYFALVCANALDRVEAAACHWIMLPDMPVTEKDRRMKPIAVALSKVLPKLRLSTRSVARWDAVCETEELRQRLFNDPLFTWKYTTRALASGLTYKPARPLTQLRCPTLVVIGDADAMTPLQYTKSVFDRLVGDKEFVTIPGAGHMGGLVEHQDEVLDAVGGFLSRKLVEAAKPQAAPVG